VTDPDGVRQAIPVPRPGGPDRIVQRVRQKVVAGLRLDGHEPAPVVGLSVTASPGPRRSPAGC
jgi:hypothetical protein